MFNKNAKFKLVFWTTMFVITGCLGTTGAIKHYNDTKSEREKARISTKETSAIVIEGNIPSRADEADMANLIVSILNDSKNHLVIDKNNNITLSDKGKLVTSAKYMYLNNEFSFDKQLSSKEQQNVVKKAKELFGEYIKYEDISINYSSSFCGASGFNGKEVYGDGEKTATETCENPFILFTLDKVRYDKDTYAALVYAAYVEEIDIPREAFTDGEEANCGPSDTKYFRSINLYTDKEKQNKIYTRNVTGCCANGKKCPSGGIIAQRSSLMSVLPNLGEKYYFRFNKSKDGKSFEFVSITKTK